MNRTKTSSNKSGVSEVIGTILLLGISVTLFSVVYISVLSFPGAPSTPSSSIAYSVNETSLRLFHVGGKPLDLDSKVKIIIDDVPLIKTINEYLDEEANIDLKSNITQDNYWGFGEYFIIDFTDDVEDAIEVMVIDVDSNSLVMSGKKIMTNRPPIISSPVPYNSTEDVPIDISELHITISDPDNDAFNWSVEGKYVVRNSSNGDGSGVKSAYLMNPLPLKTEIVWFVNATDYSGSQLWTRRCYSFISEGNHAPDFGTPSPLNGSTENSLSFSWSILIDDREDNSFNWQISCSNGQFTPYTIGDSNGIKSLSLSGLNYSTTYTVWVNATDPTPAGSGEWTRRWYTFTTVGNDPPSFGASSPAQGSTGNQLSLTWSIPITDTENNTFNWQISCSNGQSTPYTIGDLNGTKSLSLSGLNYSTTYTVWVNATDPLGSGLWTNRSYAFTTKANNRPTLSNPSPVNGTTGITRYHATNVTVSDLDGQLLTVCFWYSTSSNPYSWTLAQKNNSVPANTVVRDIYTSYSSSKNTWYWWKVTVYDGYVNASAIYNFRTGVS